MNGGRARRPRRDANFYPPRRYGFGGGVSAAVATNGATVLFVAAAATTTNRNGTLGFRRCRFAGCWRELVGDNSTGSSPFAQWEISADRSGSREPALKTPRAPGKHFVTKPQNTKAAPPQWVFVVARRLAATAGPPIESEVVVAEFATNSLESGDGVGDGNPTKRSNGKRSEPQVQNSSRAAASSPSPNRTELRAQVELLIPKVLFFCAFEMKTRLPDNDPPLPSASSYATTSNRKAGRRRLRTWSRDERPVESPRTEKSKEPIISERKPPPHLSRWGDSDDARRRQSPH